jgi:hypothetical protein
MIRIVDSKFRTGDFMNGYRMAGNASSSVYERPVTHERAPATKIELHTCSGCGNQFRPRRSWQKQCSQRCRQRAYTKRQPVRTPPYFGA